jgi:hypothetical protein
MAQGGGGPAGPNMGAITSQMGFNASGYAGIHELVFGRLKLDFPIKLDTFYAWLSSLIPMKNSFFAKRLFSLNSKTKGVSCKDLAPDAKGTGLFSEQKGIN